MMLPPVLGFWSKEETADRRRIEASAVSVPWASQSAETEETGGDGLGPQQPEKDRFVSGASNGYQSLAAVTFDGVRTPWR